MATLQSARNARPLFNIWAGFYGAPRSARSAESACRILSSSFRLVRTNVSNICWRPDSSAAKYRSSRGGGPLDPGHHFADPWVGRFIGQLVESVHLLLPHFSGRIITRLSGHARSNRSSNSN